MKVSIITVCRNDADALNRTIQSIAQQTYSDIELIIIDGQSTDHTHTIVKAAIAAGHVQKFISEADEGVYDAMNKGIRLASGDVLYFLNADDSFADNTVLADVVDVWQTQPCELLYGKINVVAQHDGTMTTVDYPEPEDMLKHLMFGWVCHQAMFARRELFAAIGGFNLQYRIAADYDWLFRALAHGVTLHYLPRPIANYRLGGLSDTDQVRSLSEMFAVQNSCPAYQEESVLQKRLQKLQKAVLQLKESERKQQERLQNLQNTSQFNKIAELKAMLKQIRQALKQSRHDFTEVSDRTNELETRLEQAEAELQAIKSSKFWKLRSRWIQLKKTLNLHKN